MPNWKHPCSICKNCVKKNNKILTCKTSKFRVHLKCTKLSKNDFYKCKYRGTSFQCVSCAEQPYTNVDESTQLSIRNMTNANSCEHDNTNILNSSQTSIFPCIECSCPVDFGQRAIECGDCSRWVHLNCTDLNEDQFIHLGKPEVPFFCLSCKPRQHYASMLF